MIRRPPRSTLSSSSAASDVYKRQVSGRDVDKFAITGFTAVRSGVVDAPYIEEVPLVLECRLAQIVQVGIQTMFVGEIADMKADVTGHENPRDVGEGIWGSGCSASKGSNWSGA